MVPTALMKNSKKPKKLKEIQIIFASKIPTKVTPKLPTSKYSSFQSKNQTYVHMYANCIYVHSPVIIEY